MTWGRRFGARGTAIVASVAVTAATVLAMPVAASATPAAIPAAPTTSPAAAAPLPDPVPSPADAEDAQDVPDAQPRMDEYSAADYQQEAAALPAELVEAVGRDLGKTGEEYLATADAGADAVQVVDALADRGVDVLGSRLDDTVLTVSVGSAADAALVRSAGAVAELGEPVTRDFSTLDFVATMDLYGGQGYAWENQDGTAGQCSVGFPGYQVSSGKQRLLTAGHCLAGMEAIVGDVYRLDQARAGSGGTFGRIIGPPLAGSGAYGDGFDTGQIHVNAGGEHQAPAVLTWGGGASYPLGSAPVAVLGQSAAIEGGVLCKSGSRTGWSCGNVLAVDETVEVSGADVNTIVSDACVQPGDSGGSVVAGSLAIGVVSGSTEGSCDDPSYFSVFFPMVSASGGASVQSRYGTTWELAVAVPAPVVTRVVEGTTKAAGSISGTLAVANRTSRVRLYLDGSKTPYATVGASTGRWSVTLGPLAAGPHRYTAVAEAGTWSRSAETSDYITVGAMAAAGDVVRVSGGALYLLDGKKRLVPVPSAAIAAELTSRPIRNRTPEALAAFTIDTTAKLGTEISCGEESYLASAGKLWKLAYGPTGLPVTTLDEATCTTFAYAPESLYGRILLRSPATGDIYLLDAGTKRRLVSMAAVSAFRSVWGPDYLSLSAEALAGIPSGRELLAPGSLVKTAGNPAVYLVDGKSRKIPVASFDTAAEYGVRGFTVVADALLDAYTTASSPLTIVASCPGNIYLAGGGRIFGLYSGPAGLPTTTMNIDTCRQLVPNVRDIEGDPFVRNPATGEVFLVREGKKSPIRSMAAVIALAGGTVPLFVELSRTSLDGIPTARELLGPGTLVKTPSSPVVYLVDGLDRAVPIDSFDLAAEFGAVGYSTVPGSVLGAYAPVAKTLSLAVTCGSSTYVAGGGSLWRLSAGSTFGLRATALDARTCGALRESAQPVANALFVRNTATGAIYNVARGKKVYMATMAAVYARNGGVLPVFVPLSAPVLATLPTA